MEKDVQGFLEKLSELTMAYGIAIGGCGCCGSPYLMDRDGSTEINGLQHDELIWVDDDHYELKNIYKKNNFTLFFKFKNIFFYLNFISTFCS